MAISRLAVVAALVTAAIASTNGAASAATAIGAGTPLAATTEQHPISRPVFLPTGTALTAIRAPGEQSFTPATAGTPAASDGLLMSLRPGGASYDVPADALPYLGHGLDPNLFNIGLLARKETGGRLAVQIGYRGTRPRLPGVTITHTGSGTATGYLTASSARAFGAALARQYASDHSRGHYGPGGLLRGIAIRLAGMPPGTNRAKGGSQPVHTLTVRGTNLAGKPDTGDNVLLVNVDNSSLLNPQSSDQVFQHGVARFSVPAGHYAAFATFNIGSGSVITAAREDVLPQFTVSGGTTVTADARAATSEVSVVTPRPARLELTNLGFLRVPKTGETAGLFFLAVPPSIRLWVNPTTKPVTIGKLQVATSMALSSPPGQHTPYRYDLAFADTSGIITSQRHILTSHNTATMNASYYSAVKAAGSATNLGLFPFEAREGNFVIVGFPLTVPSRLTEYLSTGPSLVWFSSYLQSGTDGGQYETGRIYRPGETVTERWGAYPLHPGVNTNLTAAANPFPFMPSASRAGNTLGLDITPFSDSTPGHIGNAGFRSQPGVKLSGSYQIDENGKEIASGNAVKAAHGHPDLSTHVLLKPQPSMVRFMLSASAAGPQYPLSPSSQTVWTWRSAPNPGARLPLGWVCANGSRSCTAEPMLTLRYSVAGLALNGLAPGGRQRLDITIGHLQLAQQAAITHAGLQFSLNNGATWRDATMTRLGPGRYRVTFTAPPGSHVSLRTSAADSIGGSITETITRAYQTQA